MINPKTNKELKRNKRIVFTYKLEPEDANGIQRAYESKYTIIDTSDCLEDLIAISSAMVFINPSELTEKQFTLLEEYFKYEDTTSLIFSRDPNKDWDYIYYVDNDLKNATVSWGNGYDKDALDDKYLETIDEKNIFLSRIDKLICDPQKYTFKMDRIVMIEKNCHLYEYMNQIIELIATIPSNEKVSFRHTIISELDNMMSKYQIQQNR